jgi:hypothetical protein
LLPQRGDEVGQDRINREFRHAELVSASILETAPHVNAMDPETSSG